MKKYTDVLLDRKVITFKDGEDAVMAIVDKINQILLKTSAFFCHDPNRHHSGLSPIYKLCDRQYTAKLNPSPNDENNIYYTLANEKSEAIFVPESFELSILLWKDSNSSFIFFHRPVAMDPTIRDDVEVNSAIPSTSVRIPEAEGQRIAFNFYINRIDIINEIWNQDENDFDKRLIGQIRTDVDSHAMYNIALACYNAYFEIGADFDWPDEVAAFDKVSNGYITSFFKEYALGEPRRYAIYDNDIIDVSLDLRHITKRLRTFDTIRFILDRRSIAKSSKIVPDKNLIMLINDERKEFIHN